MSRIEEILEQFHNVAANPKKQMELYLSTGKKVIACAPVYTPEEIIHSMDIIPFGVWGADIEVKEAKKYYPAFICSVMQSILELGISGKYKGISAIVIPSLCDSLKCLGENWKYAVKDIPFIPMMYPQNRKSEGAKDFVKAGYERVIKDLENITGLRFSDEKLKQSNKIYNRHNAVMRELSVILIDYPNVSALNRNEIFKSSYFMEKKEHTALVEEFISELKKHPIEKDNKIKIITTGILADSLDLLKMIDENNMQIVGDDIASESRQFRIDSTDEITALDSLADKFLSMGNCSVLFDEDKKRADNIVSMVKERNAKGVIVLLTKFCDPEEFDYVIIKKALDKVKIPCLLIEVDRQMTNYEQARTMIETFKDMLIWKNCT